MAQIGWLENGRCATRWWACCSRPAILEGALMRVQLVDLEAMRGMEAILMNIRVGGAEATSTDVYYSMLTAHPIGASMALPTWG
jgi:hypothetical protein